MTDRMADYRWTGGDLWNCPNPQRLAVLWADDRGHYDTVADRLTSGLAIRLTFPNGTAFQVPYDTLNRAAWADYRSI